MNISYEGIGQWAATFACDHLAEGELVKISANGTVSTCSDGESFCGMVLSTARDGLACSVALGGMITAGYSGESAPALGWSTLARRRRRRCENRCRGPQFPGGGRG